MAKKSKSKNKQGSGASGKPAGKAGAKPVPRAASATTGQQPLLDMWPRLSVTVVAAALAFLLPGLAGVAGAVILRGVMAGLVVGLSVRSWRELGPTVAAGAVGTLVAGLVLLGVLPGAGMVPTTSDVVAGVLFAAILAGVVGAFCAMGKRAWAAWAGLAVVGFVYLFAVGAIPGEIRTATADYRAQLSVEPKAEQYGFDGQLFLRTEFLMESGTPYYQAYLKAFDEDSRMQGTPPGLFNIRQPWLFWMWRYLPGPAGSKILGWFIVWALATGGCAYLLARRFVEPGIALLAPIAVLGYLTSPALSMWLTLSEYWAGCVAVWFLAAMVHRRWSLGAGLIVLAFAFRELMLFLVPVYIVWWLVAGRPRAGVPGLAAVLAGPAVLVGLHAWWSPVHGQGSAGVAYWLQGGLDKIVAALRFSGALVPLSTYLYLLAPAFALAGALQTRARWTQALLGSAVLVPVVALTVFSNGQWGDYWGAIAMPAILALVPLAAVRIMPADAPPSDPAVA